MRPAARGARLAGAAAALARAPDLVRRRVRRPALAHARTRGVVPRHWRGAPIVRAAADAAAIALAALFRLRGPVPRRAGRGIGLARLCPAAAPSALWRAHGEPHPGGILGLLAPAGVVSSRFSS